MNKKTKSHISIIFQNRWVVASEVAPNHLRPALLSITVGINWLFSFTVSKITPTMLTNITYGTFLLFGFWCLIMAIWAYFCLPETSGVGLEDVKYLFERDVIVRSVWDAPGGKKLIKVLCNRKNRKIRVLTIKEMKRQWEADSRAERVEEVGSGGRGRVSSETSSDRGKGPASV